MESFSRYLSSGSGGADNANSIHPAIIIGQTMAFSQAASTASIHWNTALAASMILHGEAVNVYLSIQRGYDDFEYIIESPSKADFDV